MADRIQAFDFTPSKIKSSEVLQVAECILGSQRFAEQGILKAHLFANPHNPNTYKDLTVNYHMATTITLLSMHRAKTLQLTVEEPAGYTMLGIFGVHFGECTVTRNMPRI